MVINPSVSLPRVGMSDQVPTRRQIRDECLMDRLNISGTGVTEPVIVRTTRSMGVRRAGHRSVGDGRECPLHESGVLELVKRAVAEVLVDPVRGPRGHSM